MKIFKTRKGYPVKNNCIFLFFLVAVFLVSGCAKIGDPSPLSTDYYGALGDAVSSLSVSGAVVKNRDSVGVQKFDESSWIRLPFMEEVDTSSGGIRVFNVVGEEVPFMKEWVFSGDGTILIMKPGERLNYNTVYILNVSGAEMYDLKGRHLDLNRDGVRGEVLADNFVFPFVTFKSDNSKGDWKDAVSDKIPPFVVPSLNFIIEGQCTDYVWTDVDIALNIYDYTWEAADTSITFRAVDAATLNKSKFKIIDEQSNKEVVIKDIEYIGDKNSENFGRVLIDPVDNLNPDSFYILKVLEGISDSNGNKLGTGNSVVFEKRFRTLFCNSDSTRCIEDKTAPVILNWRNIGPAFEISFSELIDPKSITDRSVYIEGVEGELSYRNECGQTFVRFITSRRISLFGYTAFVTGEIRDLSGNKVKESSHYFARKVD
jgi:hypothetical protein